MDAEQSLYFISGETVEHFLLYNIQQSPPTEALKQFSTRRQTVNVAQCLSLLRVGGWVGGLFRSFTEINKHVVFTLNRNQQVKIRDENICCCFHQPQDKQLQVSTLHTDPELTITPVSTNSKGELRLLSLSYI